MKWVQDDQLATRILADLAEELEADRHERSTEPHVTELIYCLTRSWYQRNRPLPPTPNESMIFLLGLRLERILLAGHRRRVSGNMEGILFEIDSLDYREDVEELKTTRLSASKEPDEFPQTWVKQVLAYLYCINKIKAVLGVFGLGSPLLEATLAVLHLMGSYKPPFPQLKVWHGTAEMEEVEDNWQWLQMRRVVFEGHLRQGTIPKQFTYNEDWECTNCRYKLLCDANQAVEDLRGS